MKRCPAARFFHKDTETFSNIRTECPADFEPFCDAYQQNLQLCANNKGFCGKPETPEKPFPVSVIPWISFEEFSLNLSIFTMGQYHEENGAVLLSLSVQVHHTVCDGFHLCRFMLNQRKYRTSPCHC